MQRLRPAGDNDRGPPPPREGQRAACGARVQPDGYGVIFAAAFFASLAIAVGNGE
jgi:hypothetical protein